MKQLYKSLAILVFAFVISCATSGSIEKIRDRAIVSQIIVGTTNQHDVYNLFGEPTYRGTRESGDTWWAYYHPGSGNGSSLSIDFTQDGRVKTYNYTP